MVTISTSISAVKSAKIRRLSDYWNGLRGDRPAPRRDEIDPSEIGSLLPYIMITQLERDPFRVRFRLVGTKVVEITGFEFTGRYLDQIALPEDEGEFEACYRMAAEKRAPVFSRPVWHVDQWTALSYDFAVFPLSDDGATIDKALSIECYDEVERHPSVLRKLQGPSR
ncbi:PAS domain-containing protein [Inquilinus sp. CAU 1745]|uniref:PAS domain-containing protein n=1 Tax=Inquilinus sp. CAU 1745 TaxID=3140369 RepID=UPI00325B3EA6